MLRSFNCYHTVLECLVFQGIIACQCIRLQNQHPAVRELTVTLDMHVCHGSLRGQGLFPL